MEKRGRPRKNGLQDCWIFLKRMPLTLFAYDQSREAGEKHSEAIKAAVSFIREVRPPMPISESEVRRILATWRGRGRSLVPLVSKVDPSESVTSLAGGRMSRRFFAVSVGPRPTYPRANAK